MRKRKAKLYARPAYERFRVWINSLIAEIRKLQEKIRA